MIKPQEIKLGDVIVVESVIDLSPVFTAADKLHMAQPAQLMRHGRLAHFQLFCDIADVHLAIEQNRDDPQAGRVAEGAEQVSKMSESVFLDQHNI